MRRTLLTISLTALSMAVHPESRVAYVGEGRYACQGNTADCAHIDQANRRESDYRMHQNQREQDRAQSVVDRERRKEQDRRDEQRRTP